MRFNDTDGTMEVGVARVDITPVGPVRLSGFAARSKSQTDKVLHRLWAKAVVFGSDAQGPSVFITVDLLGIQWRIASQLVDRLSKKTGIDRAQIVIAASHTHGGPEVGILMNHLQCRGDYPTTYGFSDSLLSLDQLIQIAAFNEWLSERLEEVALAALENRKPSLVAWGQGRVSFAVNRRTAGGPVDQALPILRVTDREGALKVILVNYACHGITLGPDVNEIHGDWMGEAQLAIEANYPGAIALVSIGCAGDAHPVKQGKLEYMKSYGREILDQVDRVISSTLQPLTSPPIGRMKWVKLPFSNVPTVSELIRLTGDRTVKGYYARLALERIQRGEVLPAALDYPIQVWSFGNDLLMVNMGSEVVVDYAIRLKAELGADRLWMNAYSNDVSCYIASRRVLREGGYEADASMYWFDKPSPLSEDVEEIIVNTVTGLVSAHFKQE